MPQICKSFMISAVGNGLCAVPRLYGRERSRKYEPGANKSQRNATQGVPYGVPLISRGRDVLLAPYANGTIWVFSSTLLGEKKCSFLQHFSTAIATETIVLL